jgi:hypothetical protein
MHLAAAVTPGSRAVDSDSRAVDGRSHAGFPGRGLRLAGGAAEPAASSTVPGPESAGYRNMNCQRY